MDFSRRVGRGIGGSRLKKLKYSPDAREKLKQIKQYVRQKFGADTANKVIREMMKSIRI